jgi:hypothetical protein
MRDVLAVTAVIVFFALGAAYIVACARILAGVGDIDEPLPDDDDNETEEATVGAE